MSLVSQNITSDRVLDALPVLKHARENWQSLLEPLYQNLFPTMNIFWTKANGGKWLQLHQASFLSEDLALNDSDDLGIIREFLVDIGINIVQIISPYTETIKFYLSNRLSTLGPCDLRKYLRLFSSHLVSRSFETKMSLLLYALSDENYLDMTNIQLLPLDDGNFAVFDGREKTVFIDSADHPRSLLMPGYTGRFMNSNVPSTIMTHFHRALLRTSEF